MTGSIETIQKFLTYCFSNYLRLMIYSAVIISAAVFFEEIVDDVFFDPLEGDIQSEQFDQSVSNFITSFATQSINEIMRDLTSLGSTSVISLLCLITGLIMLIYKRTVDFLYLIIVCGGIPILVTSLKRYFGRERPPEESWLIDYIPGFSFPSGHTFAATSAYLAIAYILSKNVKHWSYEIIIHTVFALVISSVALSRIYLGVHYASDVMAGICTGVTWTFLVNLFFEGHKKYQSQIKTDANF